MHPSESISSLTTRLWPYLTPRRRWQFSLLGALMMISSFAEILSIGAVLPFLAAVMDPTKLFNYPVARPVIQFFGIIDPSQILLPLAVVFALAAIMSGAIRLLLLWTNTRVSFGIGADLSYNIYQKTLYQPYSTHLGRNSSDVINAVSAKASAVTNGIFMGLNIISAMLTILAILVALLYVSPSVTLVTVVGLFCIYGLAILLVRKRLMANSRCVARESTNVIKVLQEGLGAIRDVLIDGNQPAYCRLYRAADQKMRRASGNSTFLSGCPRYVVEALAMALIAAVSYALVQQGSISEVLPILGAIALAAQRALPLLQQSYAGWAGIKANQASIQDALDLLGQTLPPHAHEPRGNPIPFHDQISLHKVSFRFNDQCPWIFSDLSLIIPKGGRLGFVGPTGSGKSTLLDLIMALLQPVEGVIKVDGEVITQRNCRGWQAHIAHVPQSIFLADGTIEENIAFGVPNDQVDRERVCNAARQAQIATDIESWPNQYQTCVGERGVRLSGGQRQRIGIARALYKNADVLVLDEATSALDSATEDAVMRSIEELHPELTILIIAHRISTLRHCTQIVKLSLGGMIQVGTFREFFPQQVNAISSRTEHAAVSS
ncbi:MAG: ABC transporter ATP-binding protein/permease [Proteobacteria bacterium]|nr:ABC transporter ATP-binding protein/permease [Pseudomonadota bacterium]MBU2620548.1 ABC transporter ATP-binding protein/permease [Pseudomonadota bacterium]